MARAPDGQGSPTCLDGAAGWRGRLICSEELVHEERISAPHEAESAHHRSTPGQSAAFSMFSQPSDTDLGQARGAQGFDGAGPGAEEECAPANETSAAMEDQQPAQGTRWGMEDLPEDCVLQVLARVSLGTGSLAHALVCQRWAALAAEAQLQVTLRRKVALTPPALLGELRRLKNLTALNVGPGSLQSLSDPLLRGLSLHCSLRHVSISDQAASLVCFRPQGLAALFSGCPRLRSFRLRSCGDIMELPDNLTGLKELEVLEFGTWAGTYSWTTYPNLTGLPENFGQLSSLRLLTLVSRSLHALPPSFSALTGLTELNIHSVELGDLPDTIGSLASLRRLRLRSQLLTSLPEGLGSLRRLQHLCLNFCNCLFELPGQLGQLKGLQELEIINCYSLLQLPHSFGQLSSLEVLRIHGCAHLAFLPADFGALQKLRDLSIKYARRLRCLPASMGSLRSLTSLQVQTCDRIEELPCSLGQLQNLQCLTVSGCRGIRELPAALTALSSLTALEVSECSALRTIPPGLTEHLPCLRQCVMRDIPALAK